MVDFCLYVIPKEALAFVCYFHFHFSADTAASFVLHAFASHTVCVRGEDAFVLRNIIWHYLRSSMFARYYFSCCCLVGCSFCSVVLLLCPGFFYFC